MAKIATDPISHSGSTQPRTLGVLWQLEPRMMFDGAALATAIDVLDTESSSQSSAAQFAQNFSQESSANISPETTVDTAQIPSALVKDSATLTNFWEDGLANYQIPDETPREIIFVDTGVADYEQILSGIDPNVPVVLLDRHRDGVEQIASYLSRHHSIDAVHIISHGSDGLLRLGTGSLTLDTMKHDYVDELTIIQQALSEQADILIYGCDFAKGSIGRETAVYLAKMTGADVEASTNPTGSTRLGGDWDLEFKSGNVESKLAVNEFAHQWASILATYIVTNTDDTGAGSLHQAILDANANANAGTDSINFNIPGVGVHTITLTTSLPSITDDVAIDGSSEPDFSGSPIIVLNGGGTVATGLNFIAGSDGSSVRGLVFNDFSSNAIALTGTSNVTVAGNYIGIDATGTIGAGNGGAGIRVASSSDIVIGGLAPTDRNVISGNHIQGIKIVSGSTNTVIQGNYIGLNAAGTTAVGNGIFGGNSYAGIEIESGSNTIGGTALGAGNIISGNGNGILIDGSGGTGNNIIQGNYIGTNAAGTAAVSHVFDGIRIYGDSTGNIIGGSSVGAGNVISGNGTDGIQLDQAVTSNTIIRGNKIGVNASATAAIGNQSHGILVTHGDSGAMIGGTGANDANIIGGTVSGEGIQILGASSDIKIQGNYIGTDSTGTYNFGMATYGVRLGDGAHDNLIGGTGAGEGNVVTYSNRQNSNFDGIRIFTDAGVHNAILGNAIYGTKGAGLGIDIAIGNLTTNDAGDIDAGSNNSQNFPVLNSARSVGGDLILNGAINSEANSYYRVEFFSNTGVNLSGYGEGQRYLGFVNVATDAGGNASLNNFTLTGVNVQNGQYVSATATKSDAAYSTFTDTSEFSQSTLVNNAPALVDNATVTMAGTNENTISPITSVRDLLIGAGWNDSDSGALKGIAITGISGNMNWNFSPDGGSTWFGISILNLSITNALLLGESTLLRYIPDSQNGETATLSFVAWDQTSGVPSSNSFISTSNVSIRGGSTAFSTEIATGSLTVTSVNDAPIINSGSIAPFSPTDATTPSSGTTVDTILSIAGYHDVDTGAVSGVSISGTTGLGTWQYSTDGAAWTAFGAVSATHQLLLDGATQIRYVPDGAHQETASMTFRAWDQTSLGIPSSNGNPQYHASQFAWGSGNPMSAATAAASIFVASDHVPINTLPSNLFTALNTIKMLSAASGNAISISDADAGSNPVRVTLTVTHGTLTLAGTTGLTLITGDGMADATMTFSGTLTDINAALDGLSYAPTTDYRGLDRLTITTNDSGTGGSSATLSDTHTLDIHVGALVVTNASGVSSIAADTSSIGALIANDGGDGISLREAILATNNTAGADYIYFNIAGAGPHTINQTVLLPEITDAVVIDGTSEPDFSGTPVVVLNGGNSVTKGLMIHSDDVTIRGLVIQEFTQRGIEVGLTVPASNITIAGNYIGTDVTGMTSRANGAWGIDILFAGSGIVVGGTQPQDRNVISGNNLAWGGIAIDDTQNVTVIGNYIGVGADGVMPVGNSNGIVLFFDTTGARIGGTAPGEGNIIANSLYGSGIKLYSPETLATILGNSIYDNLSQGIDLESNDSVLINDVDDDDAGANDLQNYPVLASAISSGGGTVISGSIDSTANTTFRIEFFSSPSGHANGHGEGRTYLGFVTIATDSSGSANFSTTLTGLTLASGHVISSTATIDLGTGHYGATSEFSQNVVAVNLASVLNSASLTVSEGGTVTLNSANFAISDVDSIHFNYSLTGITGGYFQLSTNPGIAITSFTTTNLNAETVQFIHNGGEAPPSFNVTINDGVDDSNTVAATINFTNVNDAPINHVPGAQIVASNESLAIDGISVSDAEGSLRGVQLSVANGVLAVTLSGNTRITAGANDRNSLTLSGSLADINATLSSVVYRSNSDYLGTDTLTIISTDSGNAKDSDTVSITVVGSNHAPVNEITTVLSAKEDTSSALNGIGIADIDGDLSAVRLSVTNGILQVTTVGTVSIISGSNNSGAMTLSGTQTDINATLSGLRYLANADYFGTDRLNILSVDSKGFSDSDATTIIVQNVNDAPINVVPHAVTINKNESALAHIGVTDIDGNLTTVELSVAHGTLHIVLSGSTEIIAGAEGTRTMTISGTQDDINATLAHLFYRNDDYFSGMDTLSIGSVDSDGLTDIDTMIIMVSNTPLAPPPIPEVPIPHVPHPSPGTIPPDHSKPHAEGSGNTNPGISMPGPQLYHPAEPGNTKNSKPDDVISTSTSNRMNHQSSYLEKEATLRASRPITENALSLHVMTDNPLITLPADEIDSLIKDERMAVGIKSRTEELDYKHGKEFTLQVIAVTGFSMTACLLTWLTRSGVFFAGLLSFFSTVRSIDPLAILDSPDSLPKARDAYKGIDSTNSLDESDDIFNSTAVSKLECKNGKSGFV